MSFKVLVSIGDFWQWFEDDISRNQLDNALRRLFYSPVAPDGFEIGLPVESLHEWAEKLRAGKIALPRRYDFLSPEVKARVLESSLNTIHLPRILDLVPYADRRFTDSLRIIAEHAGITEATVHPDEMADSDLERVLEVMPSGFVLSIENMDKRKANFQSLNELGALLDKYPECACTFDVCHWVELGHKALAPELMDFLTRYAEQLSKIHYSAPSSKADFYRKTDVDGCHFLGAHSGWELEEFILQIKQPIPYVIEGTVPRGRVFAVESEISSIHAAMNESGVGEAAA